MALTDEAIDGIKTMIVSGELQPGHRLPPEKDLAERLGLSRTPLREAVKALEVLGVLDVRQGDGTFVTSLQPAQLLEAISFVTDMQTDRSLLEISSVVSVLEPHAVSLAASRIDDETVQQLRQMVDQTSPDTPLDDLVVHDLQFHQTIAQASGNGYLASLLDGMANKTLRARVWSSLALPHSINRILDEHAQLVDALERRDADLARAVAMIHSGSIHRWITDTTTG